MITHSRAGAGRSPLRPHYLFAAAIVACLWATYLPVHAAPSDPGPPPVNPGRPTVTDIASLTAPGYLEAETGLNYASRGPGFEYQDSEEFLLKLTDRLGRDEFRVSTDGYLLQRTAGGPSPSFSQGYGDTTFGLQHLFIRQSPTTYDVAGRLEYKLPTASAADGLGTGQPDYNILLLASKNYNDRLHCDYNLADAFLGRTDDSGGYVQQAFASAAMSYAVAANMTLQTEIFGFTGNSVNPTNIANGYGITYTPRPDSEYDAYVAFGLTRGAPKLFVSVGHTFFLGKLF